MWEKKRYLQFKFAKDAVRYSGTENGLKWRIHILLLWQDCWKEYLKVLLKLLFLEALVIIAKFKRQLLSKIDYTLHRNITSGRQVLPFFQSILGVLKVG